jgi:hypothetical protein
MRKSFVRRMGLNFQRLSPTRLNSIGVPAAVTKQHGRVTQPLVALPSDI